MGERLPLTFPDCETYHRFRDQLAACFQSEGIHDAVVLQVGRAATGWEVDPRKPMEAWTPESPAEFAVFSEQALEQAMRAKLSPDPALVWDGKYVSLLVHSNGGRVGFSDTPIGRKLRALGSEWQQLLTGHPEFQFRLCLSAEPFTEGPFMNAIVVLSWRGSGESPGSISGGR